MTKGESAGGRRRDAAAPRRSERAFMELKALVLSGKIAPGERLYESGVAERFSLSRTPVREALMRLLEEGLLDRDGRAYVVHWLHFDEIAQLYDIRECLECRSVVRAINVATDQEIDALQDKVQKDGDRLTQDGNRLDSEFHLAIAQMSRNDVLLRLLSRIHEKVRLVRNYHQVELSTFVGVNEEHLRIIDAIKRRNTSIAEAEMREHLRGTIEAILHTSLDAYWANPESRSAP